MQLSSRCASAHLEKKNCASCVGPFDAGLNQICRHVGNVIPPSIMFSVVFAAATPISVQLPQSLQHPPQQVLKQYALAHIPTTVACFVTALIVPFAAATAFTAAFTTAAEKTAAHWALLCGARDSTPFSVGSLSQVPFATG